MFPPFIFRFQHFMHANVSCSTAVPVVHAGLFDHSLPAYRLQWSVIVPVCNEADHLADTLDALRQQTDNAGQSIDPQQYEVLVLLNNCTDASPQIAAQYQKKHPTFRLHLATIQLPPECANVGTARRLLMDEACQRLLTTTGPGGIIASTDGDTTVAPDWLWQIEQEISRGCDAVGGRILTRAGAGSDPAIRQWHLRDVTYRTLVAQAEALLDPCPHDPWPRHFQHFGANLALTCQAYQRAGGLPAVPHLEDEALYRALLRVDARVRQSPAVRVFTSTRTQGRVAIGFSEQLRYWDKMNQNGCGQVVEPATAIIRKIRARRQLRACWQQPISLSNSALCAVAKALSLDPRWLISQLTECRYFGQLWERVEQQIADTNCGNCKPEPITDAIARLRAFLRQPEAMLMHSVSGEQIESVGRLALVAEVR
jgi:hypothetical protein